MTRTNLGILLGLAVAAFVASRLDGARAAGTLGGYLLGGGIGLVSVAWQRHQIRLHVGRAMRASLQAFLMKLFVALAGVLVLRFVEPAGRVLDWRAFLLAYTAAALLALALSTLETSRALKESTS